MLRWTCLKVMAEDVNDQKDRLFHSKQCFARPVVKENNILYNNGNVLAAELSSKGNVSFHQT